MRADIRGKRDAFLARLRERPSIMGILNVTPDSFSDGGRFLAVREALAHARRMAAAGADIIDVGAESTRPDATPVDEAEEIARLVPVLSELAANLDVPLSIDTTKAAVAACALELGAAVVNDVWGLQRGARMADAVAQGEAAVVITHNRAEKDGTLDIVSDLRRFFDQSLAIAERSGIPTHRIILDIGIGFAKTSRQNRDAIARIGELKDYGLPVLVGASRKRFLGSLTGDGSEATLPGTLAVGVAAVAAGASMLRVHDVAEHAAALQVFRTMRGMG